MNKNGQTLVIFIILLPIILLIIGFVFEMLYINYNKNHLISITKTIITKTIDTNEKNDIINLYNINDIDYDNIEISFENGLNIIIDITYKSYIGNLIGKENYKYHLDITGYKENEIIKFKKG